MTRCLIYLSILLSITFAQEKKGMVLDSITLLPVSYASLEIPKRKIVSNADAEGQMSLSVSNGDILYVSCVGYETRKIKIDDSFSGVVYLIPRPKTLSTIILTSKNFSKKNILNDYKKCSFSWYTSSGLTKQIAQEYQAEDNCRLDGLRICRGKFPFNPGGTALYRIRIYTKNNETGSPGDDLLDYPIEVNSTSNTDKIDLSDKGIYIPKGSFFVAIEWLHIEANKQIEKVSYPEGKRDWVHYRPDIGTEDGDGGKETPGIWLYTSEHGWLKAGHVRKLRIAATVRY